MNAPGIETLRKSKLHIALIASLFVLAVPMIAFFVLPWKAMLAQRLQAALERKGFQNVRLTMSDVDLRSATVNDISLGGNAGLTLKNLVIHYRPDELWRGNLRDLTVAGLAISATHGQTGWTIAGAGRFRPEFSGATFSLPASSGDLAGIPFDSLMIGNSHLNLASAGWRMEIPLQMEFHKTPAAKISCAVNNLAFHMNNLEADAGNAAIDAHLDDARKQWDGDWTLTSLSLKNGSSLPPLDGQGTVSATAWHVTFQGSLADKSKTYHAEFRLDQALDDPAKSTLTIVSGSVPWKQGAFAVHNVTIPLASSEPINFALEINHVSVGDLLQSLSSQRINATGMVSGSIPVTIGRGGSIAFQQGTLKAEGSGTIALPPDLIPDNNPQAGLARQLLQDLHYSTLYVGLGNGENGALAVTMTVEGNNPAVENGRPVKLNVHLKGDVLDLVRQNVMSMTTRKQAVDQSKP